MICFCKFQEELVKFIKDNHLEEGNVEYVVLDPSHWVPWHVFMGYTKEPELWTYLSQDMFGTLNCPCEFKVVFTDFGWIEYNQCFNSKWIYHEPLIRPPHQYFEKKEIPRPSQITLRDYIINKL